MLPQENRIRTSAEFRRLTRTRPCERSIRMVVYVQPASGGISRAGVIVSRAVGGSVVRSRVSRRLRHALRGVTEARQGGAVDIVVRALPGIVAATSDDIGRDLARAVARGTAGRTADTPAQPAADPPPPVAPSVPLIRNGPGARVTGWRRALAWPLIVVIRGYQRALAPLLLGQQCRYHPSCSTYAIRALQVHGPFTGLALAGWRLLRCNPFSPGGLDPVPRLGHWHPEVHPDGSPRQQRERRR